MVNKKTKLVQDIQKNPIQYQILRITQEYIKTHLPIFASSSRGFLELLPHNNHSNPGKIENN